MNEKSFLMEKTEEILKYLKEKYSVDFNNSTELTPLNELILTLTFKFPLAENNFNELLSDILEKDLSQYK